MKTIKGKTIARAVATDSDTVIKVGASPVPHAELGAQVKDALAAHAWALEIVEYSDCIQLNVALSDGKLDANCFQRVTYPEGYNTENGTDLVPAAAIHFELLGLCPGKTATLDG